MAWAAGAFTRIFGATGWVDDKNVATNILSSRHDTHDQDLADGINACLTRDNQAKPTADFLPSATGTLNIGSSGVKWKDGNFSGTVTAGTISGTTYQPIITSLITSGSIVLTTQNAFSVNRITTAQNLPQNTITTLIFNGENFDVGNAFDSTTGIFTAPIAGLYQFNAGIWLQNNDIVPATLNAVYFSRNNANGGAGDIFNLNLGPVVPGGSISAGSNAFVANGSAMIKLALNDTVRIKADVGAVDSSSAFAFLATSYLTGYCLG